jgi:hypothetical protein
VEAVLQGAEAMLEDHQVVYTTVHNTTLYFGYGVHRCSLNSTLFFPSFLEHCLRRYRMNKKNDK